MAKGYYYITFSYKLRTNDSCMYDGENEILEAIGKRYSDGSGYLFDSGERDVSFLYRDKQKAISAIKKVRSLKRRIRTESIFYKDNDDIDGKKVVL